MALPVLGRGVVVDEVVAGQDTAQQVGVGRIDARVDDRDDGTRTGAHRVCVIGVDHVEPPLVGTQRISRRGGRAAGHEQE
jgi:hypothetical protein